MVYQFTLDRAINQDFAYPGNSFHAAGRLGNYPFLTP